MKQIIDRRQLHLVMKLDMEYKEGDEIFLYDVNGRKTKGVIGFVTEAGTRGLPDNIVTFSLKKVKEY